MTLDSILYKIISTGHGTNLIPFIFLTIDSLKFLWEAFKNEHKRSYVSMDEETSRFSVFINTLRVIDSRNAEGMVSNLPFPLLHPQLQLLEALDTALALQIIKHANLLGSYTQLLDQIVLVLLNTPGASIMPLQCLVRCTLHDLNSICCV